MNINKETKGGFNGNLGNGLDPPLMTPVIQLLSHNVCNVYFKHLKHATKSVQCDWCYFSCAI